MKNYKCVVGLENGVVIQYIVDANDAKHAKNKLYRIMSDDGISNVYKINIEELETVYIVRIDLIKNDEIAEVDFDHQIAEVDTREEAIKAIEDDKDNYSVNDADTLIYSIKAVTEEEYENGDYDLDTDDVIEIDLRKEGN